ncbi:TlpA disulfide reductase family protein [Streptomyces sp. NPDC001941]|uniref:TlpA family protein disulfide reductase n=1 Tax=Streptomyces sp. NPDC001941 TaxID=3154659 RepID=UPI003326D941
MSLSRAPRRTLLAVGALAAALALSGCGGDSNGKSGGGGNTNFVTNSSGIATVAKGKRVGVNEIAGETIDDKRLDVADFKGKVVVLNVWGSWCSPCRAEAPNFKKVSESLKGKDVQFVGINTRDISKSPARSFEESYGIGYPSLYDPDGRMVLTGFPKGSLNPMGIPSTIVLDREGKIAARAQQALTEEKLRAMIDPVLAEK